MQSSKVNPPNDIATDLLAWYDHERRDLPWRSPPGAPADAYAVWLSEIMLQQTTVATVTPYFGRFMARWPTVVDLASAELDDILVEWQGLGYYARARNLHKCAQAVRDSHQGRFPDTEDGLLGLPGIGPYTAAAIAAIAFGRDATPVDGNIERVTSRVHEITEPLPGAKVAIKQAACDQTPVGRAGDFAQALMDLGATVCTPKSPKCLVCPIATHCRARAAGIQETLPKKAPKKPKPTRYGIVYWIMDAEGRVLLRRRPEKGLLGGMMEFPTTEWVAEQAPESKPPVHANWRELDGEVRHTFTHFHLELTVWQGCVQTTDPALGQWLRPSDFGQAALPTVMKKVVRHILDDGG